MSNLDWILDMDECELADFLNQWATSSKAWQRDPGETLCWLRQERNDECFDLKSFHTK